MSRSPFATFVKLLLLALLLVGHGMTAPGVRHAHGKPAHVHGGGDWLVSHSHDHEGHDHDQPVSPSLSDSVAHEHGILFGIPVSLPSPDGSDADASSLLTKADPWLSPTFDGAGLSAPAPSEPIPPCAWLSCPLVPSLFLHLSQTLLDHLTSSGPPEGFSGRTPILRC